MHRATQKAYGDVCFVEHDIPNVSITAYTSGKVYYHHKSHIYSYDLSSRSHVRLHEMQECSGMFFIKNVLCAVHANFLKVFEKEPRELRLKEVPQRIVPSNDSMGNRDGVGFLYGDSIEIFNLGRYPIQTVSVSPDLKVVDFVNVEDTTYILGVQGRILKTKNIFLTHQIRSDTPLTVIPETAKAYSGIFAQDGEMFLAAKLDDGDKKNSWIEKYEIGDRSLVLEYSFTFQSSRNVIVKSGVLLGECMVHLSNAPILVVRDCIYNIFEIGNKDLVGISPGRIYFIGEVPKLADNKLSYELSSHDFTINPNSIKVPDFIRDQQQIDHFLRNEILLQKCETILERIQSIDLDLARRESELDTQRTGLEGEMEKMEGRRRIVEERIHVLVSRARRVRVKGNLDGFYKKIEILEREIEQSSTKDFSEMKEKLKAQRTVLRGKIY